jgi:hypothetical protein
VNAHPRIEISPAGPRAGPGDSEALLLLLGEWSRTVPRRAARALFAGLIEAGRDFAATPEGERWRAVLIESQWAHKGWLLWNMIEMDDVVAELPTKPDPAAAAIVNLAAAVRAAAELPPERDRPARFVSEFAAAAEPAYDERNAFLDFALGLAALAERTLGSLTESGGSVPRLPDEAPAMNDSILR